MRIYGAAMGISGGIPAPVVGLAAEMCQQCRKDLKLNHKVRWGLSLHPSLLPLFLEQLQGCPSYGSDLPFPRAGTTVDLLTLLRSLLAKYLQRKAA